MTSILDDLADLPGTVGAAAPVVAPAGPAMVLGGRDLRYLLSLELLRAGELTVAELVERVAAAGFRVVGRASKVVSDALRWEVGHGRAVRIGRGRYRTGRVPRSTRWWMQRSLERRRAAGRAAVAAGEGPAGGGARAGDGPAAGRTPSRTPSRMLSRLSRGADVPMSGLTLYRRRQRAHRAWEATLLPKPTWRRLPGLVA